MVEIPNSAFQRLYVGGRAEELGHILSAIRKTLRRSGFDCLPCVSLNLDVERFVEYQDSDEHPAEIPFERPALKSGKTRVKEFGTSVPSIVRYFLDGSRRTYKVADVILDGRYLPLVAGQVGVCVLARRDDGSGVEPLREYCALENVIAFPDKLNENDAWDIQEKVNQPGFPRFNVLRYQVKPDRDPVDLGVAKIMSRMHDLEIDAVLKMAAHHRLTNDQMLVIDGPLRFKKKFDLVQFRNVIGVSKSFRPSFAVGKNRRQDVGAITSRLDFAERTSVFKTTEEDKTIGMWYMRIRPAGMMIDPLQGVIKMECYAVDAEDKDLGFDSERIDVISAQILRERNVTPFKADSRWATHIYPVYMAETYLKASFMSDVRFTALF